MQNDIMRKAVSIIIIIMCVCVCAGVSPNPRQGVLGSIRLLTYHRMAILGMANMTLGSIISIISLLKFFLFMALQDLIKKRLLS